MSTRQPIILQVPELIPGALGGPVTVRARVTSRLGEPTSVLVRVVGSLSGLDPAEIVELPTSDPVDVELSLRLPPGMSPGRHRMLVQAVDRTTGEVVASRETTVVVEATRAIAVSVSPRAVNGRRVGKFRVSVRNHDDVAHVISLRAEPDEPGLKVWLKQPEVRLRPGDYVRVKGRFATKPFAVGPLREKWFTVVGESTGASVYGRGSIRQMPMVHRGIMRILGLVGIIGVWLAGTLVVMRAIEPVTEEAAVGAEAGAGGDGGTGGASSGGGGEDPPPVSVSGTVTAVPDGSGVTVLWRPVVLADSAAADGKATPVASDSSEVASQRTETDAEGAFEVAGLDGDSLYEFTFAKAGNSSQTVLVQPAGESKVLEIALTAGDGAIGGTILNANGTPLGGATLTLTDGAVTYGGATPSSGDGVGTFRFDNLSTPGTYVLQAVAPGRGLASTTIDLAEGQTVNGVTLTLSRDISVIVGRVTSVGFEAASTRSTTPVPGVVVTATDGTVTRTTSTLSEGELAGSFALVGLPLGRTYTVTYTGDGWSPRTELVELTLETQPLSVSLVPSTGRLTGTVTVPADTVSPSSVAVTLLNSDHTYKSTDAISADGELLLTNIEPGAYVAVFEALGLEDQVREVEVSAGLTSSLDIEMTAPPGGDEVGTITVKTTNLSTNEPLDSTVTMRFRTTGCGTVSGATSNATSSACSWSTSGGGLTISQVPAGAYVLQLTRTGFRSELRTITVSPGETTAIEAALAPLGSLTGIITDAEGGFLQGAEVSVYLDTDTARADPVGVGVSNDKGEYALSLILDSRSYLLVVELDGFTTIERPLEAAVATTINIDLTMRSKAQVIGEVRQLEIETGEFTAVRAQDFTVWLKQTDGTWIDTASAGLVRGLGSYRLSLEPNVTDATTAATVPYEMCVVLNPVSVAGTPCEGGFVRTFSNLQVTTGDLLLRSAYFTPNPATISGTVSISTGATLAAETFIEARRVNDIDKSVLETVQVSVDPTTGAYTFTGLTPTTADANAKGSTYWVLRIDTPDGSYSTPSDKPISLVPGGNVSVPITLVKSPGTVEVVVVDDTGQGIEDMPVWIQPTTESAPGAATCPSPPSSTGVVRRSCTSESGIAEFTEVSAGVYTVVVGNPNESSDYLRQSIRVTVTGGDTVNRTIRMSIQLGIVQATVIDDVTGAAISGATVSAGPRTGVTDATGVVQLTDLRTGTQTVTVAALAALGYPEASAIVSVPSGGTNVAPVVIRMAKNIGDLVVNVIGPDGGPYTKGTLTVTKAGGGTVSAGACENSEVGRYCYPDLPIGATTVLVVPDPSDGFANATVVANVNRFGAAIVTVVMQRSNGGFALSLTDADTGAVLDDSLVALTAQFVGGGTSTLVTYGGGRWGASGIDPGGYDVTISAVNGSGYATRVVRIDVSSGSTANLALTLVRELGTLRVVAVDDSTGAPISLIGATVTVSGTTPSWTTTSACSTIVCSFEGLSPGVVTLTTSGPDGYAPSNGTALVLPGGRDSIAIVRLVPTNGTVVVNVQTVDGQSVVDASFTVDGMPVTSSTVSASSGIRYQIVGVAPGTRSIAASADGYATTSTVVNVDRTGSAAVTIVLRQNTGRLDLFIGDAVTGTPLAATAVAASAQNPSDVRTASAITGVAGGLRFTALSPGAWTVTVSASGYQTRVVPVAIAADETTSLNLVLQPATGTVSVRAVDAATGQAISFAGTAVTISAGTTPTVTPVTCTGPSCEIGGIAVGTATITIDAIGDYAAATITANIAASATPVVVTVPMARLGEFVVSLVDASNGPVVGADVVVTDSGGARTAQTCSTAIAGTYCFRGVIPGTVTVAATPTATTTPASLAAQTVVAVADARGAGSARLVMLRQSGSLWFTLTDASTGAPLTAHTVQLVSGATTRTAIHEGSGRYTADLDPGTWSLSVAAKYPYLGYSTSVFVATGQITQLSAALLAVEASIAGRVTTSAGAVAGAVITATPTSGSPAVTITDANGEYRLSGLATGTWTVSVSATGYGPVAAQTVTVSDTEAAVANFELTADLATLRVNVLTSFGTTVEGVAVTVSAGATVAGTATSVNGEATVPGLTAGVYTVAFADTVDPARYRPQTLSVEVERGRTTTITVYMTGAGALVEARVVGSPASHLLAAPLDGVAIGLRTQGDTPTVTEVASSASGFVRFESVEPGTYDLVVLDTTLSAAVVGPGLTVNVGGATYVVPSLGSVTIGDAGLDVFAGEIRMVVAPVTVVVGVTDSATTSPVEGATVTLVGGNLPGDRSLLTTTSAIAFTDVPPGDYVVRVSAPGYATQEQPLSVRDRTLNSGTETAWVALVAGSGTVQVTVVDTAGVAVTNATVSVTAGGATATLSAGPYSFSGLALGAAEIVVSADGFETAYQTVTVQDGGTTNTTVVLRQLAAEPATTGDLVLSIRSGSDDAPITGATVTVSASSGDPQVTTSAGVPLVFTALAAGVAQIEVSAEGFVGRTVSTSIIAGSTASLTVTLEPADATTGSLIVFVRSSATDDLLPGATVSVTTSAGAPVPETQSDSSGEAEFFDLPPGTTTIEVKLDGYLPQTITVTIIAGVRTSTTVRLDPPAATQS